MLKEIEYNPCEEEYSKRLEPVLKEIKDIFVDYNPSPNKVNHTLSYITKYIKN